MEKELQGMLDELDVSQADELLGNDDKINADLNRQAVLRVKARVFAKVGVKRSRFAPRKIAAFAAVLALVAVTFIFADFGQITLAVNRFFSLVPGIGIVENNDKVEYTLAAQQSAETSDYVLTVTNAIAAKNSITVYLIVKKKGYDEQQLAEDKQKAEESLQDGQSSGQPAVYLYIDGKKYSSSNWYMGEGLSDYICATFDTNNIKIAESSKLRVEYTADNIACNFSLISIRNFDTLAQIGPTQEHNNIWLTATSSESNGQLQVELYPVNKTGYTLIGFNKRLDNGFWGQELHLQTDKGNKAYTIPDNFGNTFEYDFDVSDGAQNRVLKVPYVIVQSTETENLSLPIPKKGDIIKVNKAIKLKDGTVTVASVEQTSGHIGDRELKINLQYHNVHENQQLVGIDFIKINFWGTKQSYAYSIETDANNKVTAIYYDLGKKDTDTLRLKADNAQSAFTDEYSLTLNNQ
jgi:hypothetical protein